MPPAEPVSFGFTGLPFSVKNDEVGPPVEITSTTSFVAMEYELVPVSVMRSSPRDWQMANVIRMMLSKGFMSGLILSIW